MLEVHDLVKHFGPVVALRRGELDVDAGEIHALVGENGAGKSTLVKILAGRVPADARATSRSTASRRLRARRARRKAAGIAVIYQEPTLFPDLSVTENIFMGRQPTRARSAASTARRMRAEATGCSPASASRSTPTARRSGLSIADQQIIEIAKAISLDARVLVMDEPTARPQRRRGRPALRGRAQPARRGRARSLFISHRFDEVFALCDTRHRDARRRVRRHRARSPTPTSTEIVRQMVGRDVDDALPQAGADRSASRARGRAA